MLRALRVTLCILGAVGTIGCEAIQDAFTYYDDSFKVTVVAKEYTKRECESGVSFDPGTGLTEYWEDCEGPWYTLTMIDVDGHELIRNVSKGIYEISSKGSTLWVKIRKWGKDGKWKFHSIHLKEPEK